MSGKKIGAQQIQVHTTWKKAIRRGLAALPALPVPPAHGHHFQLRGLSGLRMVFMDYKPARGYEGSEWVGLETFQKIFKDKDFLMSLRNSIVFNILDLALQFPIPIVLALMLNELCYARFKKVTQTILYLPHFLSWVIVGSVAYQMFPVPESGTINMLMMNWGLIDEGIPFLTEKWHWAVTYLLIGVWQTMGWGTIIYLAAITGISGELYEAAMIDGAGRWKRMWYITLPGIKGTAVTLLIMNLGKVMNSNLERLQAFANSQVRDFEYQLAVYIYEKGLNSGQFSKATRRRTVSSLW